MRLAEATGLPLSAYSVGGRRAESSLRWALAAGAERVLRIEADDDNLDSAMESGLLASVLGGHDLVICGSRCDSAAIARALSASLLRGVHAIESFDGSRVVAVRRQTHARQRVAVHLPAVLEVANEPRLRLRPARLSKILQAHATGIPVRTVTKRASTSTRAPEQAPASVLPSGILEGDAVVGRLARCLLELASPPVYDDAAVEVLGWVDDLEPPDLSWARVVVGVGRGVQRGRSLAHVSELARLLDAALGASRPAVETGLVSASAKIGQTGRSIAPHLYVAIGISGATQHVVGVARAAHVVAINRDRKAPIFNRAGLGVVADWDEIAPQLLAELRSLRSVAMP
jgi:electron transfer flavoprotein alpha subunit